jgi:crossover junction endodeoxyribonuclease RuvC
MLVLGIDPGTKVMGYGLVERLPRPKLVEAGTIRAPRSGDLPERLAFLQGELDLLLGQFPIERAAIEHAFFGRNVQSAIVLGAARGIALASLARRRIPVASIMVPALRAKITGRKGATKAEAAAAVSVLLGIDTNGAPSDATDALLLAIGCELGR